MNALYVMVVLAAFVALIGYWWMLPQERQIVRSALWLLITSAYAGGSHAAEEGVKRFREWREKRKA